MSLSRPPRKSRIETTRRILEGARSALLERGWQDWGINAIATTSGVQKVLIYRYFNGIDGLTEGLASDLLLFPSAPQGTTPEELLVEVEDHWAADPFAEYVVRLRQILPHDHAFSRVFAEQRADFSRALEASLLQAGHRPANPQTWIACLLDRGCGATKPGTGSTSTRIGQTPNHPFADRPREAFDSVSSPRTDPHELPVELL